ncbi:hypothetical protein ACFLYA_02085 [Candidatus Dependentiae bacterium]
MLDDCKYDKVKLLHEISSITWFLENHAKQNAKKVGDTECYDLYENLIKDLDKNIGKLKVALEKD